MIALLSPYDAILVLGGDCGALLPFRFGQLLNPGAILCRSADQFCLLNHSDYKIIMDRRDLILDQHSYSETHSSFTD